MKKVILAILFAAGFATSAFAGFSGSGTGSGTEFPCAPGTPTGEICGCE